MILQQHLPSTNFAANFRVVSPITSLEYWISTSLFISGEITLGVVILLWKPIKKSWFLSAKVFTTIIWIILPTTFIGMYALPFQPTDIPSIRDNSVDIFFPPLPYIAAMLFFASFPAIYSSEKFFNIRGYLNVITEYQYIKKILYLSLAVLIIVTVLYAYLYSLLIPIAQMDDNKGNQTIPETTPGTLLTLDLLKEHIAPSHPLVRPIYFLYATIIMLSVLPISIITKLLLEISRDKFHSYYSKGCLLIAGETSEETRRARYLGLGLGWYNKFLKKITNMRINYTETLFTRIMSDSPLKSNQLLRSILDSFDDADLFKPLRYILSLPSGREEGYSLIEDPLRTKIKESSDLLLPIATIIITIITTFFIRALAAK